MQEIAAEHGFARSAREMHGAVRYVALPSLTRLAR